MNGIYTFEGGTEVHGVAMFVQTCYRLGLMDKEYARFFAWGTYGNASVKHYMLDKPINRKIFC